MDERFEALCEIGDLVVNAGRSDLVETYYDLLCEHYPADILTALAVAPSVSSSESEEESDEEPGMVVDIQPEPAQPEPPLKEMGEEQQCAEDDKLEDCEDYGSDCSSVIMDSEEELVEEEIIVQKDKDGFFSLA
jgi:hypothetical protein